MPYKDKQKQLEYQRRWIAKRRSDYLEDKSCVVCGSKERLEIDHIDPEQKVSHNVWSWSEIRRNEELSKCQVLCWKHHNEKTAVQNEYAKAYTHGTRNMYQRFKCRCDPCREWNNSLVKAYRARQSNMRL